MYKGQTLTASDGYQVALYPQTACTITQTSYGSYSHRCKSQTNSGLFDVVCVSGSKEPLYAPFDCKVVAFKSGYANGNQVMLESTNMVHCANGTLQYITWGFGHDNTLDVSIGQTFKQGELVGHNGDYGKVTGIHSHLILNKGKWEYGTNIPICVSASGGNMFYAPKPIDIDDLFYADDTTINTYKKDGITFNWRKYSEDPSVVLTDNPISQTNNDNYCYIEFNSHVDNPKYSYWVRLISSGEGTNIGSDINNLNMSVGSEWELVARMTGGIAWSQTTSFDTMNGLLKYNWNWIEQYDDQEYDSLLAMGGNGYSNTSLTFKSQADMRDYNGEWAITGVCPLNSSSGMSGVNINSNTGHAFIGQKSDGTIFMGVSKKGTYGNNGRSYFNGKGYTGVELDGGGSTFLQYLKGTSYNIKDSRNLKNAILLYRRENTAPVVKRYSVTLTASPSNYGSALGSGTFIEGTNTTIQAVPKDSHYKFIKWSDGNTNDTREITINSDISLTAYFEEVKSGILITGYGGMDFQIL